MEATPAQTAVEGGEQRPPPLAEFWDVWGFESKGRIGFYAAKGPLKDPTGS